MSVVLCVGEPLISLTPPEGIRLGDAHDVLVSTGGAEANVAIALAALGVATRFAGRVGDDALGRRIVRSLEEAGVDTAHVERVEGRPTGLYLKDAASAERPMLYYRAGSAASTLRDVPAEALRDVDLVHTTGITAAISPACAELVRELLEHGSHRVSFDVNHRPSLWAPGAAARELLTLASAADVVFVGLDEAAALWGSTSPAGVRRLLPEVPELVVKQGAGPVTVFHGDAVDVAPARAARVVETTGAGDAFAAGYLAGRREGESPRDAAAWGHALAVEVIGVRSDSAPGLTRATLLAALRKEERA